jgi:hypothetical protein
MGGQGAAVVTLDRDLPIVIVRPSPVGHSPEEQAHSYLQWILACGPIPVAPPTPAYHGLFTAATTWPMTDPALGRARAVVEAALRREVEITQAPITSRAGYVEATSVASTVRARIEGMRIMGVLPPGPALRAALGVATAVTARIREWEAAQDAKLVAAQRRVPAGVLLPRLDNAMKLER